MPLPFFPKKQRIPDELDEEGFQIESNQRVTEEIEEDNAQNVMMGQSPDLERVSGMPELWGKVILKDTPQLNGVSKDEYGAQVLALYDDMNSMITKEFAISNMQRLDIPFVQGISRLSNYARNGRNYKLMAMFQMDITTRLLLYRSVNGFQQGKFGEVSKKQTITRNDVKGEFR